MYFHIKTLMIQTSGADLAQGPLFFALAPGERLALVGPSGSGKTLLVRALFGDLPEQAGPLSPPEGLAWVPQDPSRALNPFLSVEDHLTLVPRSRGASRVEAVAQARELLH